jgi:hypothetical protein
LATLHVVKLGETKDENLILLEKQIRNRMKQLPGGISVGISQ